MKHFLRVVEDDTGAIFRSGIGMPDTTVEGQKYGLLILSNASPCPPSSSIL